MKRSSASPKASFLAAALLVAVFTSICVYSHEIPRPDGELFAGATTSIDVRCLQSEGFLPVPGVTLRLCPEEVVGQPHEVLQRECEFAVADADGRAQFDGLETRDYVLHAQLEGFAETSVGPMGIGDSNPRAPRTVVVLLNPVCWDC